MGPVILDIFSVSRPPSRNKRNLTFNLLVPSQIRLTFVYVSVSVYLPIPIFLLILFFLYRLPAKIASDSASFICLTTDVALDNADIEVPQIRLHKSGRIKSGACYRLRFSFRLRFLTIVFFF